VAAVTTVTTATTKNEGPRSDIARLPLLDAQGLIDAAVERAAIQAIDGDAAVKAPLKSPPAPPDEALVQRLTAALAPPRPWQRITEPQSAGLYFQAEACRRLGLLREPLARGLLVQAEEARAAALMEKAHGWST
jgi:hypothetical protein